MTSILAIDQGTTGTTVLLVDEGLHCRAKATVEFPQHFPKPGWVEHDINEIWRSVLQGIKEVTERSGVADIAAIGITNQRETVCFWNRETLEPIAHAIVWQDRRTADLCQALKDKESFYQESTGLLLDPYFSGTKVAWALEHWPDVQSAYEEGHLAVGTIDSYLVMRLSGGMHVTEPSNASRTLCFHLTEHRFDTELCAGLGVPAEIWPEVRPSIGEFARIRGVPGLEDGIPVSGILGDQQAALLGQACIEEGMAKCTYGTGAFLLLNTGSKPVRSKNRLLTTIAWALAEDKYTYALEGSAFVAGAAVQWLRDGLHIIEKASDVEALAESVGSTDGVIFVPAFTGLGAPYWNPNARGMITGLTRGTTAAHIARATLEGIALQNADILEAMQHDLGRPLKSLNVDGGASANNFLMQFQADVLGISLKRPAFIETTSLGAVFAAGLGIGLWKNLGDIKKTWREDRIFTPMMKEEERSKTLACWHRAISLLAP